MVTSSVQARVCTRSSRAAPTRRGRAQVVRPLAVLAPFHGAAAAETATAEMKKLRLVTGRFPGADNMS
jgi:hypothetical protein